jgi:zinc protease
MSAASQVGAALATGMSLAEVETWPQQLRQVTADQVRTAARRLVASGSSGTGILLPMMRPQAQGGENKP